LFYRDPQQTWRVTELDAISWLIHGFGTRHIDVPSRFAQLATVKQIHSSTCVAAEGRRGVLGEADALLENTPGSVVAVKTADCIPILLVDERHRAVAAVHAGWRGTAARIASAAAEQMGARFGSAAADLHAAIGPGIGQCCYEVGAEVADACGARTPACGAGMVERVRAHLDLPGINRRQLLEAGVRPERIYLSSLCTMCRADDFYSFRRDKDAAGRMYSFVGIAG